eukprot:Awhi_evm1s12101
MKKPRRLGIDVNGKDDWEDDDTDIVGGGEAICEGDGGNDGVDEFSGDDDDGDCDDGDVDVGAFAEVDVDISNDVDRVVDAAVDPEVSGDVDDVGDEDAASNTKFEQRPRL